MSECPQVQTLIAFGNGNLPDAQLEAVASHLSSCATCRGKLEESIGADVPFKDALKQAVEHPDLLDTAELTTFRKELETWVNRLLDSDDFELGHSHAHEAPGVGDRFDLDESHPEWVGKYKLLKRIGTGGMGNVFLADDPDLHEEVCLKMIRAGAFASKRDLQYLHREVQSLARVRHPNVVSVYGAELNHSPPFLIMQYVPGGTLRSKMGELGTRESIELMEKVCRAVEHIHQSGFLHRDIKPDNILLTAEGEPLVGDFGLAKPVDDGESSGFLSILELGTPPYMAPEQTPDAMLNQPDGLQVQTDIWSIGVVLYELLTGQRPFKGETRDKTYQAIIQGEPVGLRKIDPTIDPVLEAIVLKCLQGEAENRFATAEELADELRRWLDGKATATRPLGIPDRARQFARRNRWAIGTAVAAAVTVVISLLVVRQYDPDLHLAALQRELAETGEVTLIGESGPPGWFEEVLDQDFETYINDDGYFEVATTGRTVVDLMRWDSAGSWRFEAEVQHKDGEHLARVGVFVFRRDVISPEHDGFTLVEYFINDRADISSPPPGVVGIPDLHEGNVIRLRPMLIGKVPGGENLAHRYSMVGQIGEIEHPWGKPTPWRKLRVDVIDGQISAWCDGKMFSLAPVAQKDSKMSEVMERAGFVNLIDNEPMIVGLLIEDGACAYRNVRVTELIGE